MVKDDLDRDAGRTPSLAEVVGPSIQQFACAAVRPQLPASADLDAPQVR
jgi:hypothetical protein